MSSLPSLRSWDLPSERVAVGDGISLFFPADPASARRVLGGEQTYEEELPQKSPAQGWLYTKTVKRERKRKRGVEGERFVWETQQLWFYWEQWGRKRSGYVPRSKEAIARDQCALKRLVQETLEAIGKEDCWEKRREVKRKK